MTIYLINIALIFVWGVFFLHINPTDSKKKVYCGICATQWIILSGFRHWTVGADTIAYSETFEHAFDISLTEYLNDCRMYLTGEKIGYKDPGYYVVQKIFQFFSDDYQMWLIFIAVLFTGLMARWVYKYSSMPDISFLIYSVLFYSFYAITGHRQTIATALIFFLGYEYAKKKQFIKFAIVAFVAFMIHKSSIVFILYYFFANISITPIYFIIMMFVSVVVAVLGKQLYGPIALFFGFNEDQVNYDVGGAETYAAVLTLLCLIAFCFYPWVNKQRRDAKNIYNLMFFTLIATLLVFQNQTFMRIQQYFSIIIMVIVPELIKAFDKNYRLFVYLFIVVFLTLYIIRINPYYKFVFME